MNSKQHNILKWLLFALLIIGAVAVMYYQNRPIKEVEDPIIKQYRMEVKQIRD